MKVYRKFLRRPKDCECMTVMYCMLDTALTLETFKHDTVFKDPLSREALILFLSVRSSLVVDFLKTPTFVA